MTASRTPNNSSRADLSDATKVIAVLLAISSIGFVAIITAMAWPR